MFEIFGDQALPALIMSIGYIGLFGIVFVESGLFIGFFLPGDSLLFTAGLLASQGYLNIYITIVVIAVAAVLGDNVGYAFGSRVGRRIFEKKDSFFFNQNNLVKAENFYEKYGSATIILARFVPIVRTFAPIVAGMSKMSYKKFVVNNIVGGLLWTFSMTLAGFFLVRIFPGIENHLTLVVVIIIIISILPPVFYFTIEKFKKKKK